MSTEEPAPMEVDAAAAGDAMEEEAPPSSSPPPKADEAEGPNGEAEAEAEVEEEQKERKSHKKKHKKDKKSSRRKREKDEDEEEAEAAPVAAAAVEANGDGEGKGKAKEEGGSSSKRSRDKDKERKSSRRDDDREKEMEREREREREKDHSSRGSRRRSRSRSRSPGRYRRGGGGGGGIRRRSPTPPRVRESRRQRSRRSRSRSRSRDRRRRSRSRSRDRRRRRSRSGSRSRSRSRGRRERKEKDRDEKGGRKDQQAAGAGGEEAAEPEEELPPGVVNVQREAKLAAGVAGPLPTIASMIKEDPQLGVVKAMQRLEELKQARALGATALSQAAAFVQANLTGAQQAKDLLAANPLAPPSPALTRPARELFVGNLPPGTLGPQLSAFLAAAMQQMGLLATVLGPGCPVTNTWVSPDGRFAFVEFRSVQEATNALGLNNLAVGGATQLRVGRPKEYQAAYLELKDSPLAAQPATLGGPALSTTAAAAVAAAAVAAARLSVPGMPPAGMGVGVVPAVMPGVVPGVPVPAAAAVVAPGASNYLMLMNLPTMLGELDVKELLKPFGTLKSFNLLKDKEGNSKGIAIFEFAERAETVVALKGLDKLEIGDKRLSIMEIPAHQANMLLRPVAPTGVGDEGAGASTVIRLQNMLTDEMDAEEVGEIKDEVTDECRKYGNLVEVLMVTAERFIFVQFGDARASQRALRRLGGRSFDGRTVVAEYYPLEAFKRQDYTAEALEDKDQQAAAAAAPAPAPAPAPAAEGGAGNGEEEEAAAGAGGENGNGLAEEQQQEEDGAGAGEAGAGVPEPEAPASGGAEEEEEGEVVVAAPVPPAPVEEDLD